MECKIERLHRIIYSRQTKLSFFGSIYSKVKCCRLHLITAVNAGSWFCFRDSWTYSRTGNIFEYSFYPDFFARIFLGYLIYDFSNLGIFFKTLRCSPQQAADPVATKACTKKCFCF